MAHELTDAWRDLVGVLAAIEDKSKTNIVSVLAAIENRGKMDILKLGSILGQIALKRNERLPGEHILGFLARTAPWRLS